MDATEPTGTLDTIFSHCGNVHDEATIMTMFVNGVHAIIRTTIDRFWDDH